ncbi:LysR family transcriptional regulator [Actinomadura hibisca]|uniref:LysR family transcriptional regulator n=1 Tax=Actinomadura hibisca TaxID=68565 RepID=UPI000AF16EAD|nr:LysR substrate-binding domain-containing protein [Actinomadura hibisca]
MEKHEIETFLTLADELHFGRTAERLTISQARVSQTVQKLERRIGAPLFERTSRRVSLTPLGKQLQDGLAPAYAQLKQVEADVTAAARGVQGALRIGFLGAATGSLTPRILTGFRTAHPGVEIQMREVHPSDPLGPLRADEVDVLLTRLPVREPDLTVGPVVLSERQVLAVPSGHRFARRESVRMADLAGEPGFGAATTFQEMITLISAGEGVAPVPASVCCFYARPDVVFVALEDAPPTEVAVVWRTAGETAKSRAFAEAARRAVKENGSPADA